MPKQRHDTGWKKQKKNAAAVSLAATPDINPDALAQQLVLNGLASQQILNSSPARRTAKSFAEHTQEQPK